MKNKILSFFCLLFLGLSFAHAADPYFNYTGNPGFVNDSIEPNYPQQNTGVRFEVKYFSDGNIPPASAFPKLKIVKDGVETSYLMLPLIPLDTYYIDGKDYFVNTSFGSSGFYEYYFEVRSSTSATIVQSPRFGFLVLDAYHNYGNFLSTSGAVAGTDSWDQAIDIKTDSGGNVYVLGYYNPYSYIIKYSTGGAFLGRTILEPNVQYKKLFINSSNHIFAAGDYYDYQFYSNKVSVSKYDSSMVFMSSSSYQFSASTNSWFSDMTGDGSALYICSQNDDSRFNISKIGFNLSPAASFDDSGSSNSSCNSIAAANSSVFALTQINGVPVLVKLPDTLSPVSLSSTSVSNSNNYQHMSADSAGNTYLLGQRQICDTYCENFITLEKRDFSLSLSSQAYQVYQGWNQPTDVFVDTMSNVGVSVQIENNGNSDYGVYLFDSSTLDIKNFFYYDGGAWDSPRALSMSGNNVYVTGISDIEQPGNIYQSDIRTVRLVNDLSQNRAPELLWLNSGDYWYKGVSPQNGLTGGSFDFKILYRDLDSDPTAYIRVEIYKDGTPISGSPFDLYYESGISTFTGIVYHAAITLPGAGQYSYKFSAADFHGGSIGLAAKGYPAENMSYGPVIAEGFSGNLSLSTGAAYSMGWNMEPEDITVLSRSGEGDYVYALAEIDNSPYIIKFSTGLNSLSVSSQIVSNDPYHADLIFNDKADNIYLAGLTSIANKYYLDVRRYNLKLDNTKSGTFNLGMDSVSLEDSASDGSSSYILFRDVYNGKQRARISAFDNTLTHVYLLGAEDLTFRPHNADGSSYFDAYPSGMVLDSSGNIYIAGYYYHDEIGLNQGNNIFVAKFDASNGYSVSSFTFTSPGAFSDDKAQSIDLDQSGNIFVSGIVNNGQRNMWLALKLDNSLNLVNSKLFDAGELSENYDVSFSTHSNSLFISGYVEEKGNFYEKRYKGLVLNLDSNLVFKSSFTYGSNNEDTRLGFADLNSQGQVYVLGLKRITDNSGTNQKIIVLKPSLNENKAVFNLFAFKKSDNSPMRDMNISLIPYNPMGYPDVGLIDFGVTSSSGNASFSVVKGLNYLIAVSTPGYSPRVKEQVYDPYGNFNKTFTSNISSNYYFSPLTTQANTLRLNIKNVYKGALLMGEVYFLQNGERAAYGILSATGPISTMEIHNVPNIAAGSYGVNVNIPGFISRDIYPFTAIPSTSPILVDMSMAGPPSSNYTQNISTASAFFSGLVLDLNGSPIQGASVRAYCNCGPSGCEFEKRVYSDANGRFAAYGYDSESSCSPLYYEIGKIGYNKYPSRDMGPAPSFVPPYLNITYMLTPATYSVSGYVRYMGSPIAYAKLRIGPSWDSFSGSDSYAGNGKGIDNSDFMVITDGDGYFSFTGISDGNLNISVENPLYRSISGGIDGDIDTKEDNIRITVSSSPAAAPGYPCIAGKVWVLDSTGTCKGVMPYVFDMGIGVSTNAIVAGSLTFASTYTVTGSNPLVISKSSAVVVALIEECDGECQTRKSFFSTVWGTYGSNIIPYSVSVSSYDPVTGQPVRYWLTVLSNSWANLNSFDGDISFSTSNVITRHISLVKSGKITGYIKTSDGSVYIPPQNSRPRIKIKGETVSYDKDDEIRDDGTFEFENVPGGKYDAIVQFPDDSSYVPLELEDVVVNEGKTTNITFSLKEGLYVQPKIYGLPEISTVSWQYKVMAVPSGSQMSSSFITEMFFGEPMYVFDYDAVASIWSTKVLPEGRFDFYLLLVSRYCTPGDTECGSANYNQFANFIGRSRGVNIKYDSNSPLLGTFSQPINVSIVGSIGQNYMGGIGKGERIFTDFDYQRLFADFQNQIMPLIPSVMIYDTAGDLRGFSHIICDENGLAALMNGVLERNQSAIRDSIAAGMYKYYIWGLPPGKYTAVFSNPNYPPIARNVTLPDNSSYDLNFDQANVSVGNIVGVVKSSDSLSSPLSNAMIYLKGKITSKYAVTDSSGRFTFSDMPAGSYKIEISMDGFAKSGKKFSLGKDDTADLGTFYLKPTTSTIAGKIYYSRFPTPQVKEGIKISAYDETLNVTDPQSYLPVLEDITDENGLFELKGVVPGHNYKLVVAETGKQVFSTVTYVSEGINYVQDITLADLPPEITVKIKKDADSPNKVNVSIQSPKELVSIPSCQYNEGSVFDSSSAVSLALVPAANKTYVGQFTISSASRYYTIKVSAGDSTQVEKTIVYDSLSNSKTEQYISAASLLGGNVYMDSEKEEYSGLELDAGALTQTSTAAVDMSDLAGGFFSALPNVRTVKTNKGDLTIDSVIQNIMASEVYDIDLSNAQANKSFTISLKYDKEKAAASGSLKIYQYDQYSGEWKEVPGTYDIDPTMGVVSVSVDSLESAYEGSASGSSPMARKAHKMSAISPKGYYVPSAASSSQSGKFAVFSAKPPSGVTYSGSAFEIYNMPNPFNLKDKTLSISDGWSGVTGTNYVTRGTIIKYFLPASKSGNVKLVIYNNAGEKVRTLDEGSRSGGQVYYAEWDGKNDENEDCASGVYFLMTYLNGDKLGNKPHKMAIIK